MKTEGEGRQAIGESLVSVEEVADHLGLEPLGRDGWFNGQCPGEGCEDKDESFYLYRPGHFQCYSCSCSGEVADLQDTLAGGARPSTNGHAPNLSGAEVLGGLVAFIRRFVALSDEQADMAALWVIHTHAIDAADCPPPRSPGAGRGASVAHRPGEFGRPGS